MNKVTICEGLKLAVLSVKNGQAIAQQILGGDPSVVITGFLTAERGVCIKLTVQGSTYTHIFTFNTEEELEVEVIAWIDAVNDVILNGILA